MTEPRYRQLADFYASLSEQADPARRVAWRGRWDQELRFEGLLAALGPTRPVSVLDVGCGLGDLFGYLQRLGETEIRYTGVDLLPEMVAEAQQRYPEAEFLVADLLGPDAPEGPFDYVICSGALNVEVRPDHDLWLRAMLEAMWSRTRHTLAFNVLHEEHLKALAGEASTQGLVGADVDELRALCRDLTPRLVFREDILPSDCFVWCMRGPSSLLERWGRASKRPLDLAAAYLEHRLPDQALELLQDAEEEDWGALNLRAVALLQAKRANEAEPLLQALLARAPDQHEARRNLAAALTALGRVEESVEAWHAVVQQDSSDDGARAALCRALIQADRLSEAVEQVGAIAKVQLREEIIRRLTQARAR